MVAGLLLGRQCSLANREDIFPNFYLANVGSTGTARKSTAQAKARRLLNQVAQDVEVSVGVSTPEGLIRLLSEGDSMGLPNPVLLDLNETAILLKKGAQDSSRGLLPFLTALYDCPGTLRLPTRNDPLKAEEPFLSIMSGTTATWLKANLTETDVRGGLAGRFIYITGREKPPIPRTPPFDQSALSAAEMILAKARDAHSSPQAYELSPEAAALWDPWYIAERGREYTGLLGALAGRLPLHAEKLAMVHAALEGTAQITAEQIQSGIAFAEFQREVHERELSDLGANLQKRLEDRILRALAKHKKEGSKPKRYQVRKDIGGNASTEQFNRALAALVKNGQVVEEMNENRVAFLLLG